MFVFQKFIYDNVGEWPNRYKQKKYKMYLIWPWVNSSARVNTFPLWLWCQRVVRHEDISWFPSMELLWSSEGRDWLVHPPELWSDGDRNPCNTCKENATCCTFLSFHHFSRLTCRIPLLGQTDWNTLEACPLVSFSGLGLWHRTCSHRSCPVPRDRNIAGCHGCRPVGPEEARIWNWLEIWKKKNIVSFNGMFRSMLAKGPCSINNVNRKTGVFNPLPPC